MLLQVLKMKKLRPYIPDFNLAFEHFCIHTGGAGVITEIQKQLRLHPDTVRPSQEALYRYGNTSSASIWCAPSRSTPLMLCHCSHQCFASVAPGPGMATVHDFYEPARPFGIVLCASGRLCTHLLSPSLCCYVCSPCLGSQSYHCRERARMHRMWTLPQCADRCVCVPRLQVCAV